MKSILTFLTILFTINNFAQQMLPMSNTETKKEVSMTDATGKTTNGVYKYYAKGDDKPFTGILFAKYKNGNYESWQEFENGVGQGKWINYYENGNYKEIGNYNNNLVEGSIQKFYKNGILKSKGTYKNWRIKIGEWKYYSEDGSLNNTIDYGKKGNIEEVKAYYKRGEISYQWYSSILKKNGFTED
jgi:antitoxin component YwqK of YwqJK toxin-antitoxin module